MKILKSISLVIGLLFVIVPIVISFMVPAFVCSAPFLAALGSVFLLFSGWPQRILEAIYFAYLRRRKPVLGEDRDEVLPNFLTSGLLLYSACVIVASGVAIYLSIVLPVGEFGNIQPDPPIWAIAALMISILLGLGGYATAFFFHFLPNASRQTKYLIFLVSYGFIKGALFFALPIQDLDTSIDERIYSVLLLLAIDLIVLFASAIGFSFWLNPYFLGREIREEPSKAMRRFFFLVRRFQILSAFAFYFLPFLPFLSYLFLRYYLVERFRRCPILYFRSFGLESTPTFFSKIILKEASRFGVVVCLAHESQRPYQIQGEAHPLAYGKMVVLKDNLWKPWVERELQRAAAVIIDVTKPTEGLDWELHRTRELVVPQRIMLLRQESSSGIEAEGEILIEYAQTRESQQAARRKIHYWLIDLLFSDARIRGNMPVQAAFKEQGRIVE